jgi:hypothetical protein
MMVAGRPAGKPSQENCKDSARKQEGCPQEQQNKGWRKEKMYVWACTEEFPLEEHAQEKPSQEECKARKRE